MKRILVLGAGRSSFSLINYLVHHAGTFDWFVTVADMSLSAAQQKVGMSSRGEAVTMDISHSEAMRRLIADADIVISLLPPAFHPTVALHVLGAGLHFLTARYIPDELKAWHDDVKKKGLTFLGECGLDPGIDHLSAMKIIDDIRARGGTLLSFESFT